MTGSNANNGHIASVLSQLQAEIASQEQTAANQFATARSFYEDEIKTLKKESSQIQSDLQRLSADVKAKSEVDSTEILEKYEREVERQRKLARQLSEDLRASYINWTDQRGEITRGTEIKPHLFAGSVNAPEISSQPLDAVVPFVGSKNLWIRGGVKHGWPLTVTRNAVFGAYVSVQPGQMLVTVYDPSMSGDLSLFYEMSDDNRELYREIPRTPEAFEETLDFHLNRLEDVNRAMKGKFRSLTDMVRETGQQEFPYRLLVVMEEWSNLDERTRGKLGKLIESGPKYGIHVVLLSEHTRLTDIALKSTVVFTHWRNESQKISIGGTTAAGDQAVPATFSAPQDNDIVELSKLIAAEAKQGALPEIPLVPMLERLNPSSSRLGITALVGKSGTSEIDFTIGDGLTNGLIGGAAGTGKSNLLKVIIYSLAERYSPDELEFFLLDFKQGVEFNQFIEDEDKAALPHARVVSTESDVAFGISALEHFVAEIQRRNALFKQHRVDDYKMYREETGERLPRWLLIIDEFQGLFANDDADRATELLDTLARQGRSSGLHFIIASQSLSGIRMNSGKQDAIFDQTPLRIALRMGAEQSALFLRNDNKAAGDLRYRGQAIINKQGGAPTDNQLFVVAYADKQEHNKIQSQLALRHPEHARIPQRIYRGDQPVFLSSLDLNGLPEANEDGFPVVFGQRATIDADFAYHEMQPKSGDHVLILGTNSRAALGMMQMMSLSAASVVERLRVIVYDTQLPSQRRISNLETWLDTLRRMGAEVTVLDVDDNIFRFVDGLEDGPETLVLALGAENEDFGPEQFSDDESFLQKWPRRGIHFIGHWTSASVMNRSIKTEAFQNVIFTEASVDDFMVAAGIAQSGIPELNSAKAASFSRTGRKQGIEVVTPVMPMEKEDFERWQR